MAQQMHKGTIVGYVLVGALLLALVVGGILVVKNYATKNNTNGETKVAEDTAAQSDKTSTSTDSDLQQALDSQASQQKQAETSTKNASNTTTDASTTTTSTRLPATGPEDTIVAAIGATLLAGAAVSYVRSRSLI